MLSRLLVVVAGLILSAAGPTGPLAPSQQTATATNAPSDPGPVHTHESAAAAISGPKMMSKPSITPAWTDVVAAITAVAVALFTAVLTWVGVQQWRLLRRSTELSTEALAAAKESADAARRAAEAAQKGADVAERALIDVQRPYFNFTVSAWGLIDHPDDYAAWAKLKLENIGQQPGIIQMCRAELRYHPSGMPPKFDKVPLDITLVMDPIVGPRTIGVREETEFSVTSPLRNLEVGEDFRQNRRQLYIRLLIQYRDPLGVKRLCGQTWLYYRPEVSRPGFHLQPYPESTFDRHIGEMTEDEWF